MCGGGVDDAVDELGFGGFDARKESVEEWSFLVGNGEDVGAEGAHGRFGLSVFAGITCDSPYIFFVAGCLCRWAGEASLAPTLVLM